MHSAFSLFGSVLWPIDCTISVSLTTHSEGNRLAMLVRAFQNCMKAFGLPVSSRAAFNLQPDIFTLTDQLYPFMGGEGYPPIPEYSDLWKAIGGAAGILHMNAIAMRIYAVSGRLGRIKPAFTREPASDLFWNAIRLFFSTCRCLAEAAIIPQNGSLPRPVALRCARIYCEMATTVDVLTDFYETSNTLKSQ